LGNPRHRCKCTPSQIERYRARISGPLLDRIDIHIEAPAVLYGVATKTFNQTVRRNAERFPIDFVFLLTQEEVANLKSQTTTSDLKAGPPLRSQVVTLKPVGRGRHRKYRPLAFTEHGAIMAATILRSPRAVAMSVYVVRAFVQIRREFQASTVLEARLERIERTLLTHDAALRDVFSKLKPLLLHPPEPARKEIGFHTHLKKA
jgi:hypothetical protein